MRYSPKDLIEAVERLNIDHQDTTVYLEVSHIIADGKPMPTVVRCEGFYVQGDRLILTYREGV